MKRFAFPLSIKCANVKERDECVNLFESIGYKMEDVDDGLLVTNVYGETGICTTFSGSLMYLNDSYHIDHFNPALIRDIAAACTNDAWQKDEPYIHLEYNDYSTSKLGIALAAEEPINGDLYKHLRRPTLSEICAHHGYEIKGKCIVKKTPLSAKAPILFDLEKWDFISIDQIQANGVSLEHHIDVEIKLKKALKDIQDLKHEITAWEVKYENIKQVVNR